MRLHHMGLNVADLEAALRFYRDVLGLQVVSQATRQSVIPGRGEITAVVLEDEGGNQLELIYEHARGGQEYELGGRAVHPCFIVDDLDRVVKQCKENGVSFLLQPTQPKYESEIGRIAFIEDPEGFRIELWQMK